MFLDTVSFGLYTQKLLHTNSLTHRCCLDRNAFIQRRFWHSDIFAKRYFCKDTCAQRCLYTQVVLDQGDSRQGLLHGRGWKNLSILTCTFTHTWYFYFTERFFYPQVLLHREGPSHRDGFTQRDDFTKEFFYTQVLLHRDAFNTEMLLHTGASRRKKNSTEMICQDKVLDASGFAHRCLYTEMLLHTCVFTHQYVYTVTQCFCIQVLYAEVLLHANTVTQRCIWQTVTGALTRKCLHRVMCFSHTHALSHFFKITHAFT